VDELDQRTRRSRDRRVAETRRAQAQGPLAADRSRDIRAAVWWSGKPQRSLPPRYAHQIIVLSQQAALDFGAATVADTVPRGFAVVIDFE